jgi:hypothetical protein
MAQASNTGHFQWPIPNWNADWQKWQQMFGTFAHGVDACVFGILEHITVLTKTLPSAVIIDPGTHVFSQNAAAVFVSRTLQTQIYVGPTPLTLIPGALVCASLQPGAVGPQVVDWELRDGSTPVDPALVVFGVVADDYAIRWYNGARLPLGTAMVLFDFPGGSGPGGGLDPAPFLTLSANTVLTESQNGQYFETNNVGGTVTVTLPTDPTDGMQYTVVAGKGTTTVVEAGGTNGILWPQSTVSVPLVPDLRAAPTTLAPVRLTITAKDLTAFGISEIAWIATSATGLWTDAVSGKAFDFNFPVTVSSGLLIDDPLVGTKSVAGAPALVSDAAAVTPFRLKCESDTHLRSVDMTVTRTQVRALLESYHGSTSVVPVTFTVNTTGFAAVADDGWVATFKVGANTSGAAVPIVVQNEGVVTEISIGDAPFVHSITCSQLGASIILRHTGNPLGSRGRFQVIAGSGTWTDNLGGVHVFDSLGALDGSANPNGIVTGVLGQSYYQAGVGVFWINIDGSTEWIVQ